MNMEMEKMSFKLLCWILFTGSIVACSSLPEKTVTHTAPAATLAAPTNTPGLPTPLATATPALAATPAHTACPPFPIDTTLPVPDEPQSYIGLHFDTLPAGLQSPGGSVLDGSGAYYIVSEVVRDSGDALWLERNICHDEAGHPYYELRAVLILPALQEKEKLIIGTCKIRDAAASEAANPAVPDPAIVAVGWFEDVHKPPVSLSYAWRANPQTESFEVLLPESVTCTGLEGL
jgi:hypothetical protein